MRVIAILAMLGALLGERGEVSVTEIDGSNDHRIFRIGELSRVMMEPVLWKLVDTHQVNLDTPISIDPDATRCGSPSLAFVDLIFGRIELRQSIADAFPRSAPPEHVPITLRTLYEHHPSLFWREVARRLGETPERLLQKYLVEPYGLKDTSFAPVDAWRGRIVSDPDDSVRVRADRYAGGLMTSPSDILRIGYVIAPHLSRISIGLKQDALLCGNEIVYAADEFSGGAAFLAIDCKTRRVLVRLQTSEDLDISELLMLLEPIDSF